MRLLLLKNYPGEKELIVTDMDSATGLIISIDFDDVDHESVLRDTEELIRRVNSFNK